MSRLTFLVPALVAFLLSSQVVVAGNTCQVTPSTSQLLFEVGSPDVPVARQRVTLQTCITQGNGKGHGPKEPDRYLQASTLKGPKGAVIKGEQLVVTTEYSTVEKTLDKPVRVLDAQDTTAWFEVGLASDAANVAPGIYRGALEVSGEKWQLEIEVQVNKHVHLTVAPKHMEFEVARPGIYGLEPPGKLTLNVAANHQDWQVTMSVEPATGLVHKENPEWVIPADRFYFRFEHAGHHGKPKGRHHDEDPLDGYTQLSTGQNLITNSYSYNGPSTKLQFLLDAETHWQELRAGEYTGVFVFTVEG